MPPKNKTDSRITTSNIYKQFFFYFHPKMMRCGKELEGMPHIQEKRKLLETDFEQAQMLDLRQRLQNSYKYIKKIKGNHAQ